MDLVQKENVVRLNEIKEKIKELTYEAQDLIRTYGTFITYERAKSYCIPEILMALDNDHNYIGSSTFTLEKIIEEMMEE